MNNNSEIIENLEKIFGSYKAEWLKQNIFQFFTEPYYFSALKSNNPGVLQGGRGTGKTTVLRGLSYQGQFELLNSDIHLFDKNDFIGIYYRANTNRVHTFKGKGVDETLWIPIFEHYFNLIICWEMIGFLKWHKEVNAEDEELDAHACKIVASSLHISMPDFTFCTLYDCVEEAIYRFQAEVNNVVDNNMPKLSMSGVPIEILARETQKLKQFRGKVYYLLIDEYENFMDYQQKCINTLIKHVPDSYTIKIGVRQMGWRVKTTHNNQESLNYPADYNLTVIEDKFTSTDTAKQFEDFASRVCNLRLKKLIGDETVEYDIKTALTDLSIEEEAEKLNVCNTAYYQAFQEYETEHNLDLVIHPLFKYLIAYWSDAHGEILENTIHDYLNNKNKWISRYDNYKYSLLFKLNKGKFIKIPKYFAGWKTFIKLANGNIRYLMALVYESYYMHLENRNDIREEVSAETQTLAAKSVGWRSLTELEGSCMIGMQLTKLVQSIGTIFNRLAKESIKSAPEINQFDLCGEMEERTREILNKGIMNLALVRMAANKLSSHKSLRAFQYQLHPIFAPYFDYSFRKKRKMTFTDNEFLNLIDNPNDTVAKILEKRNVSIGEESYENSQLTLFDLNDLITTYDEN